MTEPSVYLTYIFTCIAVVIVPGPTVTVIIANSVRSGPGAGLANVAGTQLGLAILLAVLALGLSAVVAFVGEAFVWLKLIGAAYLIWLGISLWRAGGDLGDVDSVREKISYKRLFWQGFFVILSNPKGLFFFGALIPQFIDPNGNTLLQTLLLGGTFMVVATVLDAVYAVLAGRAGGMLTRARVRLVQRISGSLLIFGGIWLAFQKRAS